VDSNYARRVRAEGRRSKEVNALFKEPTDELLDLNAKVRR
jgi:hypothetical protein